MGAWDASVILAAHQRAYYTIANALAPLCTFALEMCVYVHTFHLTEFARDW